MCLVIAMTTMLADIFSVQQVRRRSRRPAGGAWVGVGARARGLYGLRTASASSCKRVHSSPHPLTSPYPRRPASLCWPSPTAQVCWRLNRACTRSKRSSGRRSRHQAAARPDFRLRQGRERGHGHHRHQPLAGGVRPAPPPRLLTNCAGARRPQGFTTVVCDGPGRAQARLAHPRVAGVYPAPPGAPACSRAPGGCAAARGRPPDGILCITPYTRHHTPTSGKENACARPLAGTPSFTHLTCPRFIRPLPRPRFGCTRCLHASPSAPHFHERCRRASPPPTSRLEKAVGYQAPTAAN